MRGWPRVVADAMQGLFRGPRTFFPAILPKGPVTVCAVRPASNPFSIGVIAGNRRPLVHVKQFRPRVRPRVGAPQVFRRTGGGLPF